ncbi:MAG: TetR family transcriptional regulator [Lautropia sp.]
MQVKSNPERSEATRQALIWAARALFIEKGYAATSTPEIVAVAGVTRGALYHHYADKQALFRAVAEHESRALAAEIEVAAHPGLGPVAALVAGSAAYLTAMTVPGRTRLLLVDAPAVLGAAAATALDEAGAAATLRAGLAAALGDRSGGLPLAELATLLSAAFDRAALEIDQGGDAAAYRSAMVGLIDCVLGLPAARARRTGGEPSATGGADDAGAGPAR